MPSDTLMCHSCELLVELSMADRIELAKIYMIFRLTLYDEIY
jgi:hypothetical protein